MIIEIFADNLSKKDISKNLNRSARAVVINEDKLLMLHTKTLDYYMLPGGSIEDKESPEAAAIRELKEETGFSGEVVKKTIIIKEYFPESTWESHYFIVKINQKSQDKPSLTKEEKELKIETLWLRIDEVLNILDDHDSKFPFASNIMQREFIAITNSL